MSCSTVHAASSASIDAVAADVSAGAATDPTGIDARHGLVGLSAGLQPLDAGGPVADAHGNVVAMRTAASGGRRFAAETSERSFAIPIDRVREVVGEIVAGHSNDTVHVGPRAELGVAIRSDESGVVVVTGVTAGGPAARAGIVIGDVIAAVDNTSVTAPADLSSALDRHLPGDRVSVGWFDVTRRYRTATLELATARGA